MTNNRFPILHVYGQGGPHESVKIVGNREGLQQLKRALEQVEEDDYLFGSSDKPPRTVFSVNTADGEEYAVTAEQKYKLADDPSWFRFHIPILGIKFRVRS